MRRLRKLVSGQSFRAVQVGDNRYPVSAEPDGSDYPNVVRLDSSEYTEVR